MLKQRSFVRCVSATLCVGLLSAAAVLGAKIKDPPAPPPPPPPPPPETSVTYRFVDLGVESRYIAALGDGGLVVGHLTFSGGFDCTMPYVLRPALDASGKPASWFADDDGGGVNDLMHVLPDPVFVSDEGSLLPLSTTATCIDGSGTIWGIANFDGVGSYIAYWCPDGNGYRAELLTDLTDNTGKLRGVQPMAVSRLGKRLLIDGGRAVVDIDWTTGERPSGTANAVIGGDRGALSGRVNDRGDVMWGGFGVRTAELITSAGTPEATEYLFLTNDICDADGMNADGFVVGRAIAMTSNGMTAQRWATMWHVSNGELVARDLGAIPGISSKLYAASDINDRGQVVGECDRASFIWENGRMANLGKMVSNPPRDMLHPDAIANDGVILVHRWIKINQRDVAIKGLLVPVTP